MEVAQVVLARTACIPCQHCATQLSNSRPMGLYNGIAAGPDTPQIDRAAKSIAGMVATQTAKSK